MTVRTNLFTNPSFETSTLALSSSVTQSRSATQGLAFGSAYSLALTPASASNTDSWAAQADTGSFYPGTSAGKTYTVSGYVTLTAPLTGTLDSRSRSIVAYTRVGTGAYVANQSNALPNVAGSGFVSVTYTVPAGATEHFIRFYHGGLSGSGTVYWDAILLEEAGSQGTYFDGSIITTGYTNAWTGTPHASTSTQTPATTVTVKSRESGAWVARTAVPKVYVNGAWIVRRPKRWNGTAWVDLL